LPPTLRSSRTLTEPPRCRTCRSDTMTADDPDNPDFLIDGPSPIAPIEELVAFRRECMVMSERYPNHSQWKSELDSVEQAIAGPSENPQLEL
jgi:hypothetical protein